MSHQESGDPTVDDTRNLLQALGGHSSAIVQGACDFAAEAHEGQFRITIPGSSPVPYLVHPIAVATLCAHWFERCGLPPELRQLVVTAALLHDTLEDCDVSLSDIADRFGKDVADAVWALTRPTMRPNESSADRMRRFVDQIAAAGPAVALVKLCDLAHNLSDVDHTPADVLARAVNKGRDYYLSLLPVLPEATQLKQFLEQAIRDAERRIQAASLSTAQQSFHDRLLRVLTPATNKWDIHDAPRLLQEAFPGSTACIGNLPLTGPPIVVAGALPVSTDRGLWERVLASAYGQNGFSWLRARWFRGATFRAESGRYCVWAEPSLRGGDFMLFAHLPDDACGHTSSLVIAMQLVMAHATRDQVKLWRELSAEAVRLGMQVDIGLAMDIGVRRGQLEALAVHRRQCELACRTVMAEITNEIERRYDRRTLWHRVRCEFRIKTPDTILRKFRNDARFRWPDFSSMSDIAGVRLICPTQSHVDALTHWFGSPQSPWSPRQPAMRYDRNPTQYGYRGVHVSVAALTGAATTPVICEIQLRTLLQDAWATLSHKLAYKADARAARRQAESLRALAAALADCDATISEVFESGRPTASGSE